jgi:uncharacterized ion transporter superfamily protein YfcC
MNRVGSVVFGRAPNSLVLLFLLIVFAQLATYVIPAGEFDRDGLRVLSGTFHLVDADPLPPFAFITSIPAGLADAHDIIFFVLIVGGVLAVVRATGAIDAVIGTAIRRLGSHPSVLVSGMVFLFALGSSTIGMAEEYVAFVPILVPMCLALRMDAMVAVGIIYVGAGVGYACAALNPFTVLIAQDLAGVELASGQVVRWLLLLICAAIGVHHLLQYLRRVQQNPRLSLVHDVDYSNGLNQLNRSVFTATHFIVLGICALSILLFVYGVMVREWYLDELTAILLGVGVVTALIGRLEPTVVATSFCRGAAELTTTALLIGFARAIQVVLSDAQVIDTIINGIAQPLDTLPPAVAAIGMLVVQTICNFFIPSGSGQAFVTMPIMAPLADLTGISRQVAVLAYQFGDGFTNMVVPTNAVLMGILAIGQIPYHRWARFIIPLLVKLYVVAVIALIAAVQLGY